MTAHCLIQLQEVFYQTHSAAPAYNTEEFSGAQSRAKKKKKTEAEAALPHRPPTTPPSLAHRRTRLPFHPKETVHTETNSGDGYCASAIILYCPSPRLLRDKGPSVDEASSV